MTGIPSSQIVLALVIAFGIGILALVLGRALYR